MKRNHIFQSLVMLFFAFTAAAQQGINYKAIINDANGDVLVNTGVTIQFTILQNGTTPVFKELHSPTTDANGILIVNIGEGTTISGDFSAIDWGGNPHFLKTEIDAGDGLTDMGTTEFKAVPYALHVQTANKAIIDEVDDEDSDPANELQTLTLVDNTLSLSNGGSVELPSSTSASGQYYFADKDRDGFGYMYEPIWVLDGVDPPTFYVNNSDDCNDNDYYTQDGSSELCDGIDNNCDGLVDEDLYAPYAINQNGVCQQARQVCNGANGWVEPDYSTIDNYEYMEITCDGLDNDCDGLVDEDLYAPYAINQNGVCQQARQVCDGANGWAEPDYSAMDNYESIETTCDGLDNDCDGEIDEGWPLLGEPCFVGDGICMRNGFYVYNPDGGPPVCSATAGEPQEEIDCNYLDDDCNGIVDDGFRDENGIYNTDVACGNCYTNCQEIYDLPNAYGRCATSDSGPVCEMNCDLGYYDLDGIPQNGCEFFIDENAVYVSPLQHGGNDTGDCGTNYDNACSSITWGIQRAVSLGRGHVLVANGLYEESVNITDGISLLGGYDPVSWNRNTNNPGSIIYGSELIENHSATIIADGISQPTTISGFQIYGASNNNPSANSYAIFITNSIGNLIIRNNIILGGAASHGSDGQNGKNGLDGNPGVNGVDASEDESPLGEFLCDETAGGVGGIFSYNSTILSGGEGGGTACPIEYGFTAGNGGTGTASGYLLGGIGGIGGYHAFVQVYGCHGYIPEGPISGQDGQNGLTGSNSEGGSGGAGTGTIIASHWYGQPGSDCIKGGDGSSGGGGGAGGSLLFHASCLGIWETNLVYAPTGGGGGSGAQGGFGGIGGKPGGASFGILVTDGIAPIIEDNTFRLGIGGKGGNGGTGGYKGIGGEGGSGGNIGTEILDELLIPGFAGLGGKGGDGGFGGGGGGGAGGCAFGIFTSNISGLPAYESTNVFQGGIVGKGGTGGNSYSNLGENGADGIVENTSYH